MSIIFSVFLHILRQIHFSFLFFRFFCKTKNQFQAIIQNKTFLLERKYVSEFTTIDLCPKDEANSRSIQCNRSCYCCPLLLLLGLLFPFKWKKMLNDSTHECKTSSPSTYLCKVLHMWNRGAANTQPVAASWWRVSRATTKERQEKTNKRGSNTWGFPWRVLVHKFRGFFGDAAKEALSSSSTSSSSSLFFFFPFCASFSGTSSFPLVAEEVPWAPFPHFIRANVMSQDPSLNRPPPPPTPTSPTHPSVHPTISPPPPSRLCVIVWSETSPWHHEAKRFCVKLSEIWLSHLLNVHTHTHAHTCTCAWWDVAMHPSCSGVM